jgi:hypothetical protein
MELLLKYEKVLRRVAFFPEFYNVHQNGYFHDGKAYILRPEVYESTFYVHQATQDPLLLDFANEALDRLNKL